MFSFSKFFSRFYFNRNEGKEIMLLFMNSFFFFLCFFGVVLLRVYLSLNIEKSQRWFFITYLLLYFSFYAGRMWEIFKDIQWYLMKWTLEIWVMLSWDELVTFKEECFWRELWQCSFQQFCFLFLPSSKLQHFYGN